jgi:hypothetical protein
MGLRKTAIFRKPSTLNLQPKHRRMIEMSAANLTTTTKANPTSLPRFPLGRVFMTPGAIDALEEAGQSPQEFISRHARLEQGELSDEDHKENLFSVDKNLRIFSAFKTTKGVKIWLISEADRSSTTLLLPEEYYSNLHLH